MNKMCLLIFFIFICLFISKNNYIREKLSNKSTDKIPLILFKTGPFDVIPDSILEVINRSSKLLNCRYKYYNNTKCRQFIKYNYNYLILKAYDSLIPTAYKADLWRYCILYKYGGIYGDLTQTILTEINVNKNNADMLLVKDRSICNSSNNIQISFMATKPNNYFYKYIINNISKDILRRKRGICPLDITGPTTFGRYFCKFFKVGNIINGLNTYMGIDKKEYIVDIPLYMCSNNYICDIYNKNNIIKTKINDHEKIFYKSDKRNKYIYQWRHNLIFK